MHAFRRNQFAVASLAAVSVLTSGCLAAPLLTAANQARPEQTVHVTVTETITHASPVAPTAVLTLDPLETAEYVEPTETHTAVTPTATVNADVHAIPGFERWYSQTIHWTPCDDGFECATIKAPLSWQDPNAGEIDLALKQHPATGTPIGSLLINPGGPGGSGVDIVGAMWSSFGAPLRAAYNVIGFDPRGVGLSTPIRCLDDADKDAFLSEDFPDTEAGRAAVAEAYARFGAACEENTGELLGNVDTQSAAHDMDLIRALVGDDKLNYLGFSYGTQLGAAYAGLFPERVGRMVLDGAVDITLSADESSFQQAVGFENALRSYVEYCQAGPRCPLTGTVDDGMQQIRDLLDRALESPLPTSQGRVLTQTLAFYGIAVTLYDEASWPILTQALQEALNYGTGDFLLYLADFYNDRNPDGTFASNSNEAFLSIGCLDSRGTEDPDEMAAEAARLEAAAPTMGTFFAYGGLVCKNWPFPLVPIEYDQGAPGAPPIMVIGTTGDPATPYIWAQALADTLDSGFLVTFEGEGHTAYARSNQCIMDAVDEFLVDGVEPAAGLTC